MSRVFSHYSLCIVFIFPRLQRRRKEGTPRTEQEGPHQPIAASGYTECGVQSPDRTPPCFPLQPLDYESRERYDLKVAVQNEAPLQAAAPKAERGQARVSVQVRDVNEAPVFQENPLRTSLAEGAAPGTPVATFSARDPDTQQPQRLR